jgi:hypothetical protein
MAGSGSRRFEIPQRLGFETSVDFQFSQLVTQGQSSKAA